MTKDVIVASMDTGKRWSKGGVYDENGEVVRIKHSTSVIGKEGQLGNAIKVKYKGTTYMVGDDNNVHLSKNSRTGTKLTPEHKISTLTGLALLIEEAGYDHIGETFCLGINVPVTEFKEPKSRQSYEKFYEGEHRIKVGPYEYEFEIKAAYPLYEGYGTLCRYFEECKDQDVLVINFGSLNTTFVYFEDGIVKKDWTDAFDNGCNILISQIQSKVNSVYGLNLTEKQIHRIVDGNKIQIARMDKRDKSIVPFIHEIIKEELEIILTRIKDYKIPLEASYMICTGGGAFMYKKALEEEFDKNNYDYLISDDPTYDDVEGFLEAVYDIVEEEEGDDE